MEKLFVCLTLFLLFIFFCLFRRPIHYWTNNEPMSASYPGYHFAREKGAKNQGKERKEVRKKLLQEPDAAYSVLKPLNAMATTYQDRLYSSSAGSELSGELPSYPCGAVLEILLPRNGSRFEFPLVGCEA
jgi:hypothetical protein